MLCNKTLASILELTYWKWLPDQKLLLRKGNSVFSSGWFTNEPKSSWPMEIYKSQWPV